MFLEELNPLIKLSICQNSSPKCKTQGFQDSMRHGPSCSWHLSADFLCILCLQLRSPNTTQMPAPPLPSPRGVPRFGPVCGHIGPQYCQNWLQNDVILRSESCLAHLLEIALPPRREHHFHCFERSSPHLFLSTFLKAYFGASI